MSETISILLVDDETRNLDALETILDDPSYHLVRATDADKALHALLEHDVAAIVLDIKMPGVSGFELAQLIKGTKKFRQIPILFLTAYLVDDKDILMGYGTGAVDYLTKPVNPQILRHKVAVFADLFRKTRALAELNETLEARVLARTADLERSERAVREASAQKDRFLATLAHELRNPLAPLRTGLDILLQQQDQPPAVARTVAIMNRQLAHMVRLVDDLLDVSRISHGKLEMRKAPMALGSVLDRAIEMMRPAVVRRKQTLHVDAAESLVASVDGTRLAQIVGNLINNASKHSPEQAEIRVELLREGERALVRVIDEGAGIPTDQLERIFEPFTKIDRATPAINDGLGIGLALSRQLAGLHGGTLTAESEGEGKGATFTLALPIGAAEPMATPAREVAAPAPADALQIVLIEDNEDSAEMMHAWLKMLGHDVRVAHNGKDGVALVLEARPDVVLCDIGLPELDGIDVCKRIVGALSPPPFMVALTGWGMSEDRRRTEEAGFDQHLVKPVELQQLRVVLGAAKSARPS